MITNHNWEVISVSKPVIWQRDTHETWLLNPPREYIVCADQIGAIEQFVISRADLSSTAKYHPFHMGENIAGKRLLIERYRDRGIGDMLFLTGPMNYIQHVYGRGVHIDMYGLSERSQILGSHPALAHKAVLAGPLLYSDLDLYAAHWFIGSVTEYSSMADQPNVYDALYKQIGIDPAMVDPKYKRPTVSLTEEDDRALDSMFYYIWGERKIDLRIQPYYVVAPTAHSSMRCMPYQTWIDLIKELAAIRPVIVLGHDHGGRMPSAGMDFASFNRALSEIGGGVVNLMGDTGIRNVMSLISKAKVAVTLDSGLLYVAQALRTPAISIWGTHAPESRLGYDKSYMELAIANKACPATPCYAYAEFPIDKCLRGASQRVCENLSSVTVDQVVEKVKQAEAQ